MLTQGKVAKMAKLANLDLFPEELKKLTKDLSDIIGYVNKLSELEAGSLSATSRVVDITSRFQEYGDHDNLKQEEVVKNAPRKKSGYVVTKAVL